MRRNVQSIVIATCVLLLLGGLFKSAESSYFDKNLATGKVRVHYKNPTPSVCDAILLGVGTSMSRSDYDNLSDHLTDYDFIVIIMDHNPGNMVKTDPTKYRNCALEVKANLVSWLSGTNCTAINHWLMGGHSAGGQAAQNAIANNPSLADAIFSIDPYDCSSTGRVDVPALYWGFDMTTCFVNKDKAAKAAYYRSDGLRAFQRVDTYIVFCPCPGFAPLYFHCSFCDLHCPGCTNCMYTPDYFFADVANSVYKFVNAAFYGTWSKANLAIDNPTTPVDLFVDSDQP